MIAPRLQRLRRAHDTLWRVLAGRDSATRAGLPFDEALAPVPVLALAVLALNDRVLKAEVPSWVTGKLSDVAGLAVAPLVLTAALDTLAYGAARLGAPLDWTLRRWKLAASIAATGAVFAAVKLSPAAADALAGLLARVFGQSRIMADPTDLLTLPALAVAWWHGRRTLAHVPYGRVAWAARRKLRTSFADATAAGANPRRVADLECVVVEWANGGPAAAVDEALAALRQEPAH